MIMTMSKMMIMKIMMMSTLMRAMMSRMMMVLCCSTSVKISPAHADWKMCPNIFFSSQSWQSLEPQTNKALWENIARGTTDPGIASITWIIFPAAKLANSVARKIQVKYFKIDFNGTWIGCITSKFGHQMAPLALVTNLVTRWRHLH